MKFKINPLIFIILFFAYLHNYLTEYLLAFSVAFFHEMSHFFAAKLCGVKTEEIKFHPFGISITFEEGYIKSSEKEFIIALAGPLFNILAGLVCALFHLDFLYYINISMGIVNLLPCLPLDGGRILKTILAGQQGIIRAYNLTIKISRIFLCLIFIFSVCVAVLSRFNFSLILISAFLFGNMYQEKNNLTLITLKEILKSENKITIDKIHKTKTYTVSENAKAKSILNLLSYDYFLNVDVVDNNNCIVKTLTETQVIKGIINEDINITFKKIKGS